MRQSREAETVAHLTKFNIDALNYAKTYGKHLKLNAVGPGYPCEQESKESV